VLEPHGSVTVSLLADTGERQNGCLHVPVELVSRSGQRQVLHARAEVLLAEEPPAPTAGTLPPALLANRCGQDAIYGNGPLFHGPHFQGLERIEASSEAGMTALVKGAPAPKEWLQHPLRSGWLTDPLALDAAFQMMILWSCEQRGAGSLPCAIRRFRQFVTAFPKGGCRVAVHITSATTPLIGADLHFFDRQGRRLAVAEDYECVTDQGLSEAFRQNRLPHGA
jgi:hypothetical protein